jgi:prepilin-type N-terminal cleavage/methylation domain-containing protein
MNKKAFTFLEVLVCVIILSLVMLGITNIFIAGRRYLYHSRARLAAANYGRMFLDPLQSEVSQDAIDYSWPNCLTSAGTTHCPSTAVIDPVLNGITFAPAYTINNVNNAVWPLLRRVTVRVNWTDVS